MASYEKEESWCVVVSVLVLATCDVGEDDCENEEDECCDEPNASDPGASAVLRAFFDSVLNRRLGISPMLIRVDVEYTAGTDTHCR